MNNKKVISKILECDFSKEDGTIDFIVMDSDNELWFISIDKTTGRWGEWKKINFPRFPEYNYGKNKREYK